MSKKTLQFSIITTEKVVYQKEVIAVTLPTTSGEITVLPDHIPLVSVIKTGAVRVTESGGEKNTLAVSGGILEVRKSGEVVVLAKRSEPAVDIDVDRAQAAYDRAKAYLEEKKGQSDADYARFQALLEKSLNRVTIGNNYRTNHRP